MKWFKLHSEIKDDPKMLELDDHQRWLWICLLAMASESKQRGVLFDVRLRGLAAALRTDEQRLVTTLQLWADMGMVEYDESTHILTICHWNERQYENPSDTPEQSRERKRKSRATQASVTSMSRVCHETDTDTDPDTDTDTETTTPPNPLTSPPPQSVVGVEPEAKPTADGAIIQLWEQLAPGSLSPLLAEKLHDMIDNYGADEVVRAIGIARDANKRSAGYVEGILRRRANGEGAPGSNGNGGAPKSYKQQAEDAEKLRADAKRAALGIRTSERLGFQPQAHDVAVLEKARKAGVYNG